MPLQKELFEYVKLEEPETLRHNLTSASDDFEAAINEAKSEMKLHQEKHELIDAALKICKEIEAGIKELNKYLLKQSFKNIIGKREIKKPLPKVDLKKELKPKIKTSVEPKEALRTLRKNLSDLKRELGIE